MVPGIAPSADPSEHILRNNPLHIASLTSCPIVLQARMFAYPDAARYRLGVNYQQLPCNHPVSDVYSPYQRDGSMRFMTNYGDDPNYVRSSLKPINFKGNLGKNGYATGGHEHDEWVGKVAAYTSEVTGEDFEQARAFWKVLGKANEQQDFVHNVVAHLSSALPRVQQDTVGESIQLGSVLNDAGATMS
jgi:catalase